MQTISERFLASLRDSHETLMTICSTLESQATADLATQPHVSPRWRVGLT